MTDIQPPLFWNFDPAKVRSDMQWAWRAGPLSGLRPICYPFFWYQGGVRAFSIGQKIGADVISAPPVTPTTRGPTIGLDGSADYLEMDSFPVFNASQPFAVEVVFSSTDTTADVRLCGFAETGSTEAVQLELNETQTDRIRFFIRSQGGFDRRDVVEAVNLTHAWRGGDPHHLICYYPGGNALMEMWLDGIPQPVTSGGSGTPTGVMGPFTYPMDIGAINLRDVHSNQAQADMSYMKFYFDEMDDFKAKLLADNWFAQFEQSRLLTSKPKIQVGYRRQSTSMIKPPMRNFDRSQVSSKWDWFWDICVSAVVWPTYDLLTGVRGTSTLTDVEASSKYGALFRYASSAYSRDWDLTTGTVLTHILWPAAPGNYRKIFHIGYWNGSGDNETLGCEYANGDVDGYYRHNVGTVTEVEASISFPYEHQFAFVWDDNDMIVYKDNVNIKQVLQVGSPRTFDTQKRLQYGSADGGTAYAYVLNRKLSSLERGRVKKDPFGPVHQIIRNIKQGRATLQGQIRGPV